MRLFFEAVLDPAALAEAWTAGRMLAADSSLPGHQLRWMDRDAFHLTLRFLGEVDRRFVPELTESVASLDGFGRFELRLDRIGSFGGRRPRVIWIGVERGPGLDRLTALRRALDAAIAPIGGIDAQSGQGAFRPHLTLARVRRRASSGELAAIRASVDRAAPPNTRARVEQVALVHSTLLKDGPRYRRLASVAL